MRSGNKVPPINQWEQSTVYHCPCSCVWPPQSAAHWECCLLMITAWGSQVSPGSHGLHVSFSRNTHRCLHWPESGGWVAPYQTKSWNEPTLTSIYAHFLSLLDSTSDSKIATPVSACVIAVQKITGIPGILFTWSHKFIPCSNVSWHLPMSTSVSFSVTRWLCSLSLCIYGINCFPFHALICS